MLEQPGFISYYRAACLGDSTCIVYVRACVVYVKLYVEYIHVWLYVCVNMIAYYSEAPSMTAGKT